MGRHEEALALASGVAAKTPDGSLLSFAALHAERAGDFDIAIGALREAIQVEPHPSALTAVAASLVLEDDRTEALELPGAGAARFPNDFHIRSIDGFARPGPVP